MYRNITDMYFIYYNYHKLKYTSYYNEAAMLFYVCRYCTQSPFKECMEEIGGHRAAITEYVFVCFFGPGSPFLICVVSMTSALDSYGKVDK